jgi:TIR domain
MAESSTLTPIIFDVFLSHSHEDSEIVEALAAKLQDEGNLEVWLDRWTLVPGHHWQREMARGLEQAKTCVICISSITPSGWFRDEIERALDRQSRDETFRVIPVILPQDNVKVIDDFLKLRNWVEFKDSIDDKNAFHRLLSGISRKPPGRDKSTFGAKTLDPAASHAFRKLAILKELRDKGLIDLNVDIYFQREILGPVLLRQ